MGTTLEEAKEILHKHKVEKLLVVDRDFNLKGLITVKDIQKQIKYPNACKDSLGRLRVGAAVGVAPDTLERVAALVEAKVDVVVVDTAHGHSAGRARRRSRSVLAAHPELEVIAGNVGTYEGAADLIAAGVSAVKVGMGPGSICTTRVVSGAGMPQITAIAEAARAAGASRHADHRRRRHQVLGRRDQGDRGGRRLGHDRLAVRRHRREPGRADPAPGPLVQVLPRHGLARRDEGRARATATSRSRTRRARSWCPRASRAWCPTRGRISAMVQQLVGGLRAGMGYCGAASIRELQTAGALRARSLPPGSRRATSTTSSSPRKRPTTGWSSAGALALAAWPEASRAASCSGTRETFVTYFNGDHGLSLRHPASWRTDQAEQEGVWYRYFLAPPAGAQSRSPVSVTLLAGPATGTLDEYAQRYLADHAIATSRDEERQGFSGQVLDLRDRRREHALPAAAAASRRQGGRPLRAGRRRGFREPGRGDRGDLVEPDAGAAGALSRTDFKQQQASLGVPESWRETRRFSGGGTLVVQFTSPPLAADKGHETVHAMLSLTFESVPDGEGLEPYYWATRKKLGDSFQVVNHSTFKGGYVDVMKTETPISVSYIKRYYFADAARGACSLSFEAREDIFPRASRWADYIASTLRFGAKGAPAAGSP